MAQLKAGYWQTTYWAGRYWQEDFWPDWGAAVVSAVDSRGASKSVYASYIPKSVQFSTSPPHSVKSFDSSKVVKE